MNLVSMRLHGGRISPIAGPVLVILNEQSPFYYKGSYLKQKHGVICNRGKYINLEC